MPSLWEATAGPKPAYPALADEIHADVAIIGAGYTGLSAALHIAADGRRAVVLEADTVGWGASGRNGGLVSGKFRVPFHAVAEAYGHEEARRLHRTGKEAVESVGDIIREHGIASAGFRMCGYVTAAHSGPALAAQRSATEWLASALGDTSSRLCSAEEVAVETGSSIYLGGILHSAAGSLHPLNYVRGLASAAAGRGVRICERSPAMRLTRDGAELRIETPQGSVRARQLVAATNAYSAREPATGILRRRFIPFRSAIIATAPLSSDVLQKLLPNGRVVADTRRLLRWYRLVERRLVFGGRGAFGKEDSRVAFDRLAADMATAFPQLAGARIDYQWSGLVAMTMDQLPHVGKLEDGVFFAAGYNGTGVAMSSLMGRYLAMLTRGEKPELGVIGRPLAPIPLHALTMPAVKLVTAWYQLLDGLGR